jgi:hypothetical protein
MVWFDWEPKQWEGSRGGGSQLVAWAWGTWPWAYAIKLNKNAEICIRYAMYALYALCAICNVCITCNYMQEICKKYARNMQQICSKYVENMHQGP